MISVIVPFYNEEKILSKNSISFLNLSSKTELIFVDGGSSDKSAEITKNCGTVLSAEKGRAIQMNHGAFHGHGDIFLFLHADTIITAETVETIEKRMREKDFIGGCLTQEIEKQGAGFRFIESFGNMRARITKVFYGDQGIFVRKNVFFKIGGFPEVPIMEDVLFTKKMRRAGKTIVLPDKILVSPRRWEKNGIMGNSLLNSCINILFWTGVPLEKVKRFYDDLR